MLSRFKNTGLLLLLMALLVPDSLNAFPSDEKTDTTYPSQIDRKRLKGLIITESALYASTFVGLYSLWYKDFPQSKFHFFDDNKDWELVDKIGHATAAFCVGQIGYGSLRWAGVDKGKAMAYGSSIGFLYLTTVEVFDGFSKDWGASTGDLIANTAGTAFLIGQQLLWDEPRIMMKWSAHHTKYAQYRPDLLGSNWSERVMKDYNGHTYWLSGNIHSFLPSHNNFPKWLNIAVGYGAEGMTGPSQNSKSYNGETLPEFERRRQFYLAPDIDLSRIETNSQFLQVIFNTFGFLKIPLPTLEFSKKGVRFHPLYF